MLIIFYPILHNFTDNPRRLHSYLPLKDFDYRVLFLYQLLGTLIVSVLTIDIFQVERRSFLLIILPR